MLKRIVVASPWLLVALLAALPRAQGADEHAADDAAIRAMSTAFVKAFDAGDAKAIAAQFAADGLFADDDGNEFTGRDKIEKEFAAYFEAMKGVKTKIAIDSIRFVGADLAIEEGTYATCPPKDGPVSESDYLTIHAKRQGVWSIATSRSVGDKRMTAHEHLKELAWLIGDWVDESPGVDVDHMCKWSEDGNYLVGTFTVKYEGKAALKGDQRIGWDPAAKQFKSWVFDSEGGTSEGLWTPVDDGWQVKMHGVRPDGAVASATNHYKPSGANRYLWTSVHRIVAGDQEADRSILIVRKPPEPKSK
ncbi:MAG TPA: SgcJ/EcaC family oxidoreductase [Pirellulales bacterium]|jgi:uncharacterized protein (TIGR02246 family)|nr:SgcJ/EcaC family oxidoreductase [Pirellulales bacterium]